MSTEFDEFEHALKYWNQAALLTAQRERLMNLEYYAKKDAANQSAAQARKGDLYETPVPAAAKQSAGSHEIDLPREVPTPPRSLYKVITIYRYTRGNNDLANPGMGYGELTNEKCWRRDCYGRYHLNEFHVRRTRSARQRIDPESNRLGSSLKPRVPSLDAPVDSKGK